MKLPPIHLLHNPAITPPLCPNNVGLVLINIFALMHSSTSGGGGDQSERRGGAAQHASSTNSTNKGSESRRRSSIRRGSSHIQESLKNLLSNTADDDSKGDDICEGEVDDGETVNVSKFKLRKIARAVRELKKAENNLAKLIEDVC